MSVYVVQWVYESERVIVCLHGVCEWMEVKYKLYIVTCKCICFVTPSYNKDVIIIIIIRLYTSQAVYLSKGEK